MVVPARPPYRVQSLHPARPRRAAPSVRGRQLDQPVQPFIREEDTDLPVQIADMRPERGLSSLWVAGADRVSDRSVFRDHLGAAQDPVLAANEPGAGQVELRSPGGGPGIGMSGQNEELADNFFYPPLVSV